MKHLFHLLAFLVLIASCTNEVNSVEEDFYSYSKTGDLWRVPLIEPYEIVSPTNSGSDDWFLIVKDQPIEGTDYFDNGGEFQFSSITSVGIMDSVIVVTNENQYWPKLSGQFESTLVINLKTDDHLIFSNEHHEAELSDRLSTINITDIELLDWTKVKDDFLTELKLPESWK